MSPAADASPENARLLRIRTLSSELDAQRQFAADRGKTQESKASFILVVVGLVAGITLTRLADSPLWFLDLLPSAVALSAAVFSVLVLWPRTIEVVKADSLVSKWIESEAGQEALEDYLLESKKREIASRDKKYEHATPHLKWAFRLLLVSVGVLFVVGIVNGFIPTTASFPSAPPTSGVTP